MRQMAYHEVMSAPLRFLRYPSLPYKYLRPPGAKAVSATKAAVWLLLALISGLAQASCNMPAAHEPQGFSLQWASGARFSRAGANWESPDLCQWHWGQGRQLTLNAEIGLAHWSADKPLQPGSAWQLSAIPLWRLRLNDQSPWFVEGGVGATLFNHTRFAGESISTAFQFGDHLGLGYQFRTGDSLSLRLSHYSNAMIKEPNPGLTMLQLTYSYRR